MRFIRQLTMAATWFTRRRGSRPFIRVAAAVKRQTCPLYLRSCRRKAADHFASFVCLLRKIFSQFSISNLKSEIKRSVAVFPQAINVAAAVRRQTCPPTYVGGYMVYRTAWKPSFHPRSCRRKAADLSAILRWRLRKKATYRRYQEFFFNLPSQISNLQSSEAWRFSPRP